MNISFCKIGKSIKFNPKTWNGFGGDFETPRLLQILANNNPNDNFYIIGRNDYSDVAKREPELINNMFKHNNVYNVIEDLSLASNYDSWDDYYNKLLEKIDNIGIDYNIIMGGPHGTVNFENYVAKESDKKVFAKSQECHYNYVSPIFKYLNTNPKIPSSWIMVDPRYYFKAIDLFWDAAPNYWLSQYDTKKLGNCKFVNSDADANKRITKPKKIGTKYTGIETIFLYEYEKMKEQQIIEEAKKKKNKFRIVLNQGKSSGGLDRYPILMKYIGKWGKPNCIKNVEIFGKWEDEIYKKDPRFKGPKSHEELNILMKEAKLTLIIPITLGWVTSKWCECMNGWGSDDPGVITFFSKEYDKQCHVLSKNHFQRVSPLTFREKVKKVMTDEKFYLNLLLEQNKLLKEEYYNGEFVNQIFHKDYKQLTDKEWR